MFLFCTINSKKLMFLLVQRQRTTLNIFSRPKSLFNNQQSFLEAIAVVPNINKGYVI